MQCFMEFVVCEISISFSTKDNRRKALIELVDCRTLQLGTDP